MGYDLHITRGENRSDEGRDFSAGEWPNYLEPDPELTIDEINFEYFAAWKDDDWPNWYRGVIFTRNPRGRLVEKWRMLWGK